jgi:predicted permease
MRERELDLEIRSHLEMEAAGHIAAGVPAEEAWRLARLRFGGVERVTEECRDVSGHRWFDDIARDLRHGARSFRSSPSFAVAALLTLTLGIGGPAAILGAVRGVLLEPLPYPDAGRLVFLWETNEQRPGDTQEVSPGNFLDWRSRSRSFDAMAALEPTGVDWMSDAGPVALPGWQVYEGFFDLVGVQAALGRTFSDDEHTPGREHVIVLSHSVWRDQFAADSGIVGRLVQVEGAPWTVIGVMPAGFSIPNPGTIWIPKVLEGWETRTRGSGFYKVVARIRSDLVPAQAAAEMDGIARQLAEEHPDTNAGAGVSIVPFRAQILGTLETPMMVLSVAVVLVFFIACANLSNLQLARAIRRSREFSVRGALGAGPRRILRQLATESTVLAAVGAVLGWLFATGALELARSLAPADLPRLDQLRADGWVLAFAIGGALLAALVTGIAPIGAVLRQGLRGDLAGGGRASTATPGARRLSASLVVAEIALSLVLLIGAGLLLRSFVILLDEDLGFRSDHAAVLVVQAWSYLPTSEARVAFAHEATTRMAALPGVRSVAIASSIPIAQAIGAESATFSILGRSDPPAAPPAAGVTIVTPGYFETLGIPIERGRRFERSDEALDRVVVIISSELAHRYWTNAEDPIGRTLTLRFMGQVFECDVIGVAGDIRRDALNTSPRPSVYLLYDQIPTGACAFFVRTTGDPNAVIGPAKAVIWSLYPTMPIDQEGSLDQIVGESVQERKFVLMLIGMFAGLAFAMAVIGTFGVMSYATATRTREIGIRMAFGATSRQVLQLILSQAVRLAALGVLAGLAAAGLLTPFLADMLYGVGPADPLTFVAGALTLLAAALAACWIPAARATRLDPVVALRMD